MQLGKTPGTLLLRKMRNNRIISGLLGSENCRNFWKRPANQKRVVKHPDR
jgi:hypothetical protein